MTGKKQWIVTLSQERPLDEVRRALTGAGFEVDQVMEEIGVVTGRSDDGCAERVRAVKGVTDVSPDQPIDIGPPGSPDTW